MIKKLKTQLNKLDEHTLEVVKKSSSATIVKVLGMIAGLLVSVALGRILGPDGLGIINLTNKIVSILIILVLIGTPQLLIKEIAIAYQKQDWQHIKNYLSSAFKLNGSIAFIISILLIALAPWISETIFEEPDLKIPLMIAVGAMTFQVLSRIYGSGLIGFRKIWQSNLVNQSLSIAVSGIVLLIMWGFQIEITIINAAIAYALGRVAVTTTVSIYWRYISKQTQTLQPKNIARYLPKRAWPFLMVSATGVILSSIDTVMLGWLGNAKEVGLYTVALQIAMLTIFFLQISNSAISPKLAALYAEGKIKEMNKMVQRVTGGLMVVGIIPLIVFWFFGEFILSLWGSEFSMGYWVLLILSFGQLINIGTGASGLLLMMCGFEKLHAYINICSLVLNVLLCYMLIPYYGATGAAISFALAITLTNLIKVIFAKIKTGVMTLPFLPL